MAFASPLVIGHSLAALDRALTYYAKPPPFRVDPLPQTEDGIAAFSARC